MNHAQYDVAILGSGISGSMLATILAKSGAAVLLLDATTHPRFAIGESTVRHTLRMVKIMAERFDIEELRQIGSGENIREHVTSACGEKRHFGFIYHREGETQRPEEVTQLMIPPFREGYEAHLFRQDIDAFLYQSALHYGAEGRQNTRVQKIDLQESHVGLTTDQGETFTARYLVDATGFRSPLAHTLGLRDDPPRAKTHSRALFTHMIDVKDYDDLTGHAHGQPERWYNGTCHHLFDGGWMWVIPFDNHPKSTNPLVSVGFQLDSRRFPKPKDMTPQDEWDMWMEKYPSIAIQFADAKVVRPWVSTGRIQYSSRQTVGHRWCLMAHSAGFIDAIFSRGLANTTEILNALAPRLIAAIKDDDFSVERFDYVERLQQNLFVNTDLLAYGAYVSYRDFDLWNAWFRIWALGVGIGDLRLASIYRRFKQSHDESILPDQQEPMGLFASNQTGFGELFRQAIAAIDAVDAGTLDPKAAATQIHALIAQADFTSPVGLADPEKRFIDAGTPANLARSIWWAITAAPPDMKQMILSVAPGGDRVTAPAAT